MIADAHKSNTGWCFANYYRWQYTHSAVKAKEQVLHATDADADVVRASKHHRQPGKVRKQARSANNHQTTSLEFLRQQPSQLVPPRRQQDTAHSWLEQWPDSWVFMREFLVVASHNQQLLTVTLQVHTCEWNHVILQSPSATPADGYPRFHLDEWSARRMYPSVTWVNWMFYVTTIEYTWHAKNNRKCTDHFCCVWHTEKPVSLALKIRSGGITTVPFSSYMTNLYALKKRDTFSLLKPPARAMEVGSGFRSNMSMLILPGLRASWCATAYWKNRFPRRLNWSSRCLIHAGSDTGLHGHRTDAVERTRRTWTGDGT